jgi:hypothetical protein
MSRVWILLIVDLVRAERADSIAAFEAPKNRAASVARIVIVISSSMRVSAERRAEG